MNKSKKVLLAERLYQLAIQLKHCKKSDLVFQRKALIRTLSTMQFFIRCIGMPHISDQQVELIVTAFKDIPNNDPNDISADSITAPSEVDYSEEYDDLLLKMSFILFCCIKVLTEKKKGYQQAFQTYILAFHNLPRAFLSVADRRKITPQEALEYAKSYISL